MKTKKVCLANNQLTLISFYPISQPQSTTQVSDIVAAEVILLVEIDVSHSSMAIEDGVSPNNSRDIVLVFSKVLDDWKLARPKKLPDIQRQNLLLYHVMPDINFKYPTV